MRHNIFLLSTIGGLLTIGAVAAEVSLKEFKVSPAHKLPLPAMSDSIETGNRDFDRSKLLSAKKAADYFHRYVQPDWTTLPTDTAGTIRLAKPTDNNALLYVLTTRIRPERFIKGNLVAKSTSMMEIWVNGESTVKKATSDSLATEAKGALSIEPEMEADIEIHLLALPDDKSEPEFNLSFIPDDGFDNVEVANGPVIPKRFTINTLVLGERLNATSFSNDGKYCILYYSNTFGENDVRRYQTLIESASNKVISGSLPQDAKWISGTNKLYYSVRSGNGYDYYKLAVPEMTPQLIAKNVPVSSEETTLSPDEKTLIYYAREEGKKEEGIMRRVTEPDDRQPGNRDRYYVKKYDMVNGIETQLTFGGPTTSISDISPDWKKLIYISTRQTPSKYPFYDSSIIEMDLNTLTTDTIASGQNNISSVVYSPNGRELLIIAGPSAFNELGKNAGNHEIANDFDMQAYIFNLTNRSIKPLTKNFDPSICSEPVWNRANGLVYFLAEDGFDKNIYCLDPKTEVIKKIDAECEYVRNFSIGANDARWIAYTGMGYTFNGRGYMLNLKNGKSTLLDDTMADQLSQVEFGTSEKWQFTAEDGTVIDGEVNYPPNFDPKKKYPLIVYYYGGTSPSEKRSDHPYTPQLFASRDYVVYTINPSGTTGYGQEFSSRHVNAWGERTADEIIQGTKEFCKTHSFVDDKKIGCLGASYGGFMTQLLLTKTDIFAAAMSHAGISNVTSYWGEGYWGYSYNSVAAAKSYPWTNPELFTQRGSLFNADKIHTPLLLLHGTVDTNVPIGESIQIFNALKILGRNVEFITVEGANHVVTDFNKRKVWHATIMAWFAKWLQDDPRWWDSLYGNK